MKDFFQCGIMGRKEVSGEIFECLSRVNRLDGSAGESTFIGSGRGGGNSRRHVEMEGSSGFGEEVCGDLRCVEGPISSDDGSVSYDIVSGGGIDSAVANSADGKALVIQGVPEPGRNR